MIGVYVGFCALCWLYTSCEMTDYASSRMKFAGTNSPINFLKNLHWQCKLIHTSPLSEKAAGLFIQQVPPYKAVHCTTPAPCRCLSARRAAPAARTLLHLCKHLVSACVGAKPPCAHYPLFCKKIKVVTLPADY